MYAVHGIWCAYCEHVHTLYVTCWEGYNWQIELLEAYIVSHVVQLHHRCQGSVRL